MSEAVWAFPIHCSPIQNTQRVTDVDILSALHIFMQLEPIDGDLEISHFWCGSQREDLLDTYIFLKRKPFTLLFRSRYECCALKCIMS